MKWPLYLMGMKSMYRRARCRLLYITRLRRFSFELEGGLKSYLGDLPSTDFNESLDDRLTYTINGVEVTASFTIEFEGFDNHEIISANGAASESFHLNQDAIGSTDAEARAELLAVFPELGNLNTISQTNAVPPMLTDAEASLLR